MNLNPENARRITAEVLRNDNILSVLEEQGLLKSEQAILVQALIEVFAVSQVEKDDTSRSDELIAQVYQRYPWMEMTRIVNDRSLPAIASAVRRAVNELGLIPGELIENIKQKAS